MTENQRKQAPRISSLASKHTTDAEAANPDWKRENGRVEPRNERASLDVDVDLDQRQDQGQVKGKDSVKGEGSFVNEGPARAREETRSSSILDDLRRELAETTDPSARWILDSTIRDLERTDQ